MNRNYHARNVNSILPRLLLDLEQEGSIQESRAGKTRELTHVGITLYEPNSREITIPHRKANLAAQIAESVWVLAGRQDIEWLGHYLPRAKDFSDDGETWRAGYGDRLRHWQDHANARKIDQIRYVFETLRDNPDSRQAVASIWDPAIDTSPGKDIPCNDWLHFLIRDGRLDLHVAVRSNDVIWGWSGINQFEWSVLLEVMAGLLKVQVGSLHFSTTSFHIYEHHWAKGHNIVSASAGVFPPNPVASPRFDARTLEARNMSGLSAILAHWFTLEEMIRGGDMVDHLVEAFPEPMLQSWLRVLQWWWSGSRVWLAPLKGTALEMASRQAMQPPTREATVVAPEIPPMTPFLESLCALHLEKEAAYGGSWKKRGEMLAILANIARKVDRLGGGETADETSADTAGDLFVYLAKYRTWLHDQEAGPNQDVVWSDDAAYANEVMREIEIKMVREIATTGFCDNDGLVANIRNRFDALEKAAMDQDLPARIRIVGNMLEESYVLARRLWEADQDQYRGADVD